MSRGFKNRQKNLKREKGSYWGDRRNELATPRSDREKARRTLWRERASEVQERD